MSGKSGLGMPAADCAEHEPYISVTKGMSGYFAVMYWYNDEGEFGNPPFWEPWDTGFGRYPDPVQAEQEALSWAADEGLRYVPPDLAKIERLA